MHLAVAARLLGHDRVSSPALLALVEAHLARIRLTLAYARAQDNNHGTSEAAALYIGGHWLVQHGVVAGAGYATIGRRYLVERVERLIAKDGTFSQYFVNYHRLMLDTLSLAELWRIWHDLPRFSDGFYQRAKAASRWLQVMVDPKTGDAPNLGANDGANLLPLTDAGYRDYRLSVQLALTVFAGERDVEVAGPHDDHLAWLSVTAPMVASRAALDRPVLFDDGGSRFCTVALGKRCSATRGTDLGRATAMRCMLTYGITARTSCAMVVPMATTPKITRGDTLPAPHRITRSSLMVEIRCQRWGVFSMGPG